MERGAHLLEIWDSSSVEDRRHDVGGDVGGGPLLPDRYCCLAHSLDAHERRLDLAELDAVAAQLDLHVAAAYEDQVAAGNQPRQISGAVQAGARIDGERVGEEAARRLRRPPRVAARQPDPPDVHLTQRADRDGIHPRVQQVDGGVGGRPADRHRIDGVLLRHDVVRRGEDGRLRGTVPVGHHEATARRAHQRRDP